MRRSKRWVVAVGVIATLSLIGAACSSNDSSSTTPTMNETTSAPEPAQIAGSITDVVAGNPDFSTLLAAVQAADLGGTLAGPGPFTVFAPTNAAFAALPAGTVETLLKPKNMEQLSAILTYHVVPSEAMAADVTSGTVTTVNGTTFKVRVGANGVTITDGQGNTANVVKTDIVASNGVIHVIDAVLLPQTA